MGWETDYLGEARAAIVGAGTEQELEDARIRYLGRRSRLTEALRGAKDLSVEERAELNRTKTALEEAVASARDQLRARELDRSLAEEQVDVTLPGDAIDRGHRRDTPDATHSPVFDQVEGLAVDRGITLADLKGTLMYLSRALFGADRTVRVRTSHFPFTEPSIEFDVSCFRCGGSGCQSCEYSGWLEMGG